MAEQLTTTPRADAELQKLQQTAMRERYDNNKADLFGESNTRLVSVLDFFGDVDTMIFDELIKPEMAKHEQVNFSFNGLFESIKNKIMGGLNLGIKKSLLQSIFNNKARFEKMAAQTEKVMNSTKTELTWLKQQVAQSTETVSQIEKKQLKNTENNHKKVDKQKTYEWASDFYEKMNGEKPSFESFLPAYQWWRKLVERGEVDNEKYLWVMDFSLWKSKKRFFVVNMETQSVVYAVKAWHGKWSWQWEYAQEFSNKSWSNESSLWFLKTGSSFRKNSKWTWEWLRLYGLEVWINDQSDERGIALHPWSVDSSEWCITLPDNATAILQKMKWWALIFGYHSDNEYYAQSDIVWVHEDIS